MTCFKHFFLLFLLLSSAHSTYSQAKFENKSKPFEIYVSPLGSDDNPGTKEKPWKSLNKVVNEIKAGQTAIFEDGTYYEDEVCTFSNSGTSDGAIIVRAKNKHKAKIIFSSSLRLSEKINILDGKEFIEIRDFEITQESTALESDKFKTLDIIIACRNSSNCNFIGNKIHHAYEEGIKSNASSNILIDSNIIFDMVHEGIDFVNVNSSIISNNTILNVKRIGIVVKGGSRHIVVDNNLIKNDNVPMNITGISIGGETNKISTYDNTKTGYEGEEILAINNKIISPLKGKIRYGISFMGVKNSYAYKNIIVGASDAFFFCSVNGMKNGWAWDPINNNLDLRNNIVLDCKNNAFTFKDVPKKFKSSYNIFFNTPNVRKEKGSKYENPKFVNKYNDWTVENNSPILKLKTFNYLEKMKSIAEKSADKNSATKLNLSGLKLGI